MSEVKMKATVLWTRLVTAMRADGLLAECITQCGPATAAVMVELVQEPGYNGTWLPGSIKPRSDTCVLAINEKGEPCISYWSDDFGHWVSDEPVVVTKWTYIKLPE